MKPIQLRMTAFGPFCDTVNICFEDLQGDSLFLITGPTGAGKTTILDAMVYALFGQTSGGLRDGSDMRSDYAGADTLTQVEFTFAIGDKEYRLERSPKQWVKKKRGNGLRELPAQAVLYSKRDGVWQEVTTRAQEIKEQVQSIIGFRADQFLQVVLLPQGDFRRLLVAPTSEREELLHSLFRTEVYTRLQELLKQDYDRLYEQAKERVQAQQFILDSLEVKNLQEAVQKATQAESAAKDALTSGEAAKQYWQTVSEGRALTVKRDELQQALETADKLREGLAAHREEQRQRKALIELLPSYEAWYKAVRERDTVLQEADEVKQSITQMEAEATALAEKQQHLSAEEERLAEQAERYEQAHRIVVGSEAIREEIKSLEARRRQHRDKAAQLEADSDRIRNFAAELETNKETLSTATKEEADVKATHAYLTEIIDILGAAEELRNKVEEWSTLVKHSTDGAAQLTQLQRQYNEAVAAEAYYKQIWHAKESALQAQQAATLAMGLEPDSPCPVCGSCHHPHPAVPGEEVRPDDEARARKDYVTANGATASLRGKLSSAEERQQEWQTEEAQRYKGIMRIVTSLQTNLDSYVKVRPDAEEHRAVTVVRERIGAWLSNDTPTHDTTDVAEILDYAQCIAGCATEIRQEIHALAAALDRLQHQVFTLREAQATKQQRLETMRTTHTWESNALVQAKEEDEARWRELAIDDVVAWNRQIDEYEVYCDEYKRRQSSLVDERVRLSREDSALTVKRMETKRREGSLQQRLAQAKADIEMYLQELSTLPEWEERLAAAKEKKTELLQAIDEYDRQWHRNEGVRSETLAALNALPETAVVVSAEEERQARDGWTRAEQEAATYAAEAKRIQQAVDRLTGLYKEDEAGAEEREFVYGLSQMASGASEGLKGVTFERYVLGAILEEVVSAANLRLRKLSRGRYTLQRAAFDNSGRGHKGLDLAVFDAYTGAARPANTLSGGETFLASLSLAMGLADCIQSYAGGIHLDTMFIDEGFGTLDADTLEIAMEALVSLQSSGRLVGIISHVGELQSRIPRHLVVERTAKGSRAYFSGDKASS